MATPAEQLQTIQQNLALARANGDTQKVAALEKSQESVQALVDVNNGTFKSPTNTITSGVVQEANGGFTETSPDGTISKYNSQGIMYSMTEPNGTVTRAPNVAAEPNIPAQVAAIDANRQVQADVPTTVDQAGISALKAEQDRIAALNNTVRDPAVVAEEARIASQIEAIDANRKVQADTPATVDREGISAAAASQNEGTADQKTPADVESARVQSILDKDNTATPEKTVTEEDPMAEALRANQASNEDSAGPTEQAVLDASSEPRLSSSEQAKVEEQQAANRAALQQEDATDKAASVLIKPGQTGTITSIPDWRVKLSLAKNGANYLYNSAKPGDILYPLKQSGGVIFPYTPQIQTSYKASYDSTDLTHSNYKMFFYKSSHVEDIQITCDFTAQDSTEASYILAVIHFFKSVTKMFYGADKAPAAGTPPPLVFLSGYGQYQFNKHPMLISSFNYTLPTDVDYIRASTGSNVTLTGNGGAAAATASFIPGITGFSIPRLFNSNLNKGGATSQPNFTLKASGEPTYVPTKIQIQLSCLPVVTRGDISKNFSLSEYANGNLTKRSTGGIW